MDLVSFCYYTVMDKNGIQADGKLLATHTMICLYMCKHFPNRGRNNLLLFYTHLVTIQEVIW